METKSRTTVYIKSNRFRGQPFVKCLNACWVMFAYFKAGLKSKADEWGLQIWIKRCAMKDGRQGLLSPAPSPSLSLHVCLTVAECTSLPTNLPPSDPHIQLWLAFLPLAHQDSKKQLYSLNCPHVPQALGSLWCKIFCYVPQNTSQPFYFPGS